MPFGCDSSSFKEDLQGFIESLGDPGVPESDFTAQGGDSTDLYLHPKIHPNRFSTVRTILIQLTFFWPKSTPK